MSINIENENTLISYFNTGINLFIGSGFSVEAKDTTNNPLPVGNQLLNEILKEFNIESYSQLNLSQISSILENSNKTNYFKYLSKRFTVGGYSELYNNLLRGCLIKKKYDMSMPFL